MNILVTGSAGFIGFHLSINLLKNKRSKVFGIDSQITTMIKIKNKKTSDIKKKIFLFIK